MSFIWCGQELATKGEIREVVRTITTDEDAMQFTAALREQWGANNADSYILACASFMGNLEEVALFVNKFFQIKSLESFHLAEAPGDEHGNTGYPRSVIEVRLIDRDGYLSLQIIGPAEIANRWPSRRLMDRYRLVDGPARMLSRDEWETLVEFKVAG